MGKRVDALIDQMKSNPKSVRFSELETVCQYYFGGARKSGGSHCVYKTPWTVYSGPNRTPIPVIAEH
jgi:hypothetical protein